VYELAPSAAVPAISTTLADPSSVSESWSCLCGSDPEGPQDIDASRPVAIAARHQAPERARPREPAIRATSGMRSSPHLRLIQRRGGRIYPARP
jgi:hypothetical protein